MLLDELDEAGIDFVKKCIHIVEKRGLHEQGLYRIVGMQSKVNSVVATHFGKKKFVRRRSVEEFLSLFRCAQNTGAETFHAD